MRVRLTYELTDDDAIGELERIASAPTRAISAALCIDEALRLIRSMRKHEERTDGELRVLDRVAAILSEHDTEWVD